jgi:hypothetical protein
MPQPIDPFPIYKDGQKKVVHGVDYAGWADRGWTLEPGEPMVETVTETHSDTVPPELPTELTPYEVRKAELESLLKETQGWRNIERIAKELGITQKPAGGWDDAMPLILEAEGLTA